MNRNEDRNVVILAVLTQFIACFIGAMITIALKDMQKDLSLNSWQLNFLSIAYYYHNDFNFTVAVKNNFKVWNHKIPEIQYDSSDFQSSYGGTGS